MWYKKPPTKQKRYPKGYYKDKGIIIGIPIGLAIGLVMGNIALGIGVGVAIGISIGSTMETKYNPNAIPLTEEQKRIKRRNLIVALAVGVLTLLAGIVVFSLNK